MKIFLFSIKEEGEFKHQKAQKNFLTPGENRTRDPASSSSDAPISCATGTLMVSRVGI